MSEKRKIILTVGIPSSGKSSWASQTGLPVVSRDSLRPFFADSSAKTVLSFEQEQQITVMQRSFVKTYLDAGLDVIVDDMNLRPKYTKEWITFALDNDAEVHLRKFPVDVEAAVRWNASRDNSVPEKALREIAKKFTDKGTPRIDLSKCYEEVLTKRSVPSGFAPYEPNTNLPRAFIVDLDGTLAHNTQGRDWYALDDSYYDDEVDKSVQYLVSNKLEDGETILFVSGRDERVRDVTERWLREKVGVSNPMLFMRSAEDQRPDSVVKLELFDKHIRDNYCVDLVVDDRASVTKAWRSIGLTVWQVAEGAY